MPLRFRSASRPCPTDSWMSVPPASLESTTVYVPAGAGAAGRGGRGVGGADRGAGELARGDAGPVVHAAIARDRGRGAAGDGEEIAAVVPVAVRVPAAIARRDADARPLIDAGDRVLE